MDTSDAIPSDDDPVVIPGHLRELLRATAERMLEEACDMAFAPDARDAAIAAVHLIDAFEHESLTRGVALALIPGAIEWEEPVRMPHTLEGVAQYERQLALARELIELRDGPRRLPATGEQRHLEVIDKPVSGVDEAGAG